MTTATLTTRLAPAPTVGFGRLTRVEFRKFFDTRAGLWLMISMVAATVLIGGIVVALYKDLPPFLHARGWFGIAPFLLIGVNLLLPVMAILLVTTEWSQRTTLTTFVLEPRRGRVIAAKAVVLAVVTLAAFTLATVLSTATFAAGSAVGGMSISWNMPWAIIGGYLASAALSMAMAFSFALLFMNTPAAIVLYMALPVVMQPLSLVPGVKSAMPWFDLNSAQQPLLLGTMHSDDWLKLGVASLIWVVAPLVAGIWRHLWAEAK